jgi:hypothetical protein
MTITHNGGKVVATPLAPGTARAIGLAVGERCGGPIFLIPDGRQTLEGRLASCRAPK